MTKRLSGYNPLAYQGVEPLTPPLSIRVNRRPTANDRAYNIGTFWLVKNTQEMWILVDLKQGIATWVLMAGGSAGATNFPCNIGVAIEAAGVLNMFGDVINITSSGAGNTVTYFLSGLFADEYILDIGTVTPNANVLGVLGGALIQTVSSGGGHSILINLLNGLNGQTIIAGGGVGPAWAPFTSGDGSVTFTPGANTLNMEATVPPGSQTFVTSDGHSQTPSAGIINILGGPNINTSGAGHVLHVNLNNNVTISGSLSTGTTITAGSGMIVTSGGISSTGITRLRDLTTGVMQTDNTGLVFSANGIDGQTLIGSGGNALWRNITASGILTLTNGPHTINLEATTVPGSQVHFQASLGSPINSTFVAPYSLGSTVILDVEFDTGSNFYPGDGLGTAASFTAPVTGKYFLSYNVVWFYNGGNYFDTLLQIVTTARNYYKYDRLNSSTIMGADTYERSDFSVVADMTAGDTATYTFQIIPQIGAPVIHQLYGNGVAQLYTFVTGFFVV